MGGFILGVCWYGEGPAAAPELEKHGFLSHDVTKGVSKDTTAVSVFSLHTPEKEGVCGDQTLETPFILKGAGGLTVHSFDARPPGSEERAFVANNSKQKRRLAQMEAGFPHGSFVYYELGVQ